MVRQKNLEKFQAYFYDLWTFIKSKTKSDHDFQRQLNRVYSKYRQMDKEQYSRYIIQNLQPHISKITQKDEFLFTPEYGNKPLNFIIGLDFRQVWKKTKLDPSEKRIVFRFLELIYIQANLAHNTNKETVKQIVENIKAEQEIAKEAEENPNMFGDAQNGNGPLDLASLFGDDNLLVELAQDIAQEVDIQQTLAQAFGGLNLNNQDAMKNPSQLFEQIGNNPELRSTMETLAQKVSQRMEEREITQEDLLKSVSSFKTNMEQNISQMLPPGAGGQVKKMLKNMDFAKMAESLAENNPELADQMKQTDPEAQKKLMDEMLGKLGLDNTPESNNPDESSTTTKPDSVD